MTDILDLQLNLLERLRPFTRSDLPYRVLWRVVGSPTGLESASESALREENKNAGRAIELLERHGLIAQRGTNWVATGAGRQLVRELEKATNAPPGSVIEGRRLLSVAADGKGGLAQAERIMRRSEAEVLYADGPFELVAVLPDDPALVRDLRERLRRKGHRVSATRILPRA
jgi:hypothetical protein